MDPSEINTSRQTTARRYLSVEEEIFILSLHTELPS
jgi:hypothetical protein